MELRGYHTRRYLPAGVTDDEARVGYVAAASGGVDAIDLASGATRWHAQDALVPVIGLEDALVAMSFDGASRLQLIERSGVVLASAPLPGRPSHTQIEVVAASLEGHVARLAWRASEATVTGGTPRARSNVVDTWAASVDLVGGAVTRLDFADFTTLAPLQPSQRGGGVRDQRGSDVPWTCGDLVTFLANDGGHLVLRRWRAGSALPPVELLPSLPPLEELRWVRTPDAHHVFLVDVRDGSQRFRIWAAATGAPLGEIEVEAEIEPWTVAAIGDVFYAIFSGEQNALGAFSIANGAHRWSHPIVGHTARDVP